MAARAMWKGRIEIGGETVPVKLYSAVNASDVRFRLLNAKTGTPLQQRMIDPETGDAVEYADTLRGYPTDDGRIVVLDEEDLDALEPADSRSIEITRVVPDHAIDARWYDRPYWLGPDGDAGAYAALSEALGDDRAAVARWVMRKKEYVGALRVEDGRLMLVTLRHAGEVVSARALEAPTGRKLDARELKMAKQLVEALAADWEPDAYRDEYRDRVLELVEAKASGKRLPKKKAKPRREADDDRLADMLEESLRAARAA